MKLSKSTVDKITTRLAREPEWAASELGKTLALAVDLNAVSLKVVADYILLPERTMYRLLDSKSGQPALLPHHVAQFDEDCVDLRAALQAAVAADAFAEIKKWAGHQDYSPRDEALRILTTYSPKLNAE